MIVYENIVGTHSPPKRRVQSSLFPDVMAVGIENWDTLKSTCVQSQQQLDVSHLSLYVGHITWYSVLSTEIAYSKLFSRRKRREIDFCAM